MEQLRGQNFILCDLGNNHYAFVHRTFLEYFCAEAFVQQFEASLDLDFLRDRVFKPHWNDESWHETLCLVAGVIGKKSPAHVAQLVEFLLAQKDPTFEFHHVFLAARCCAELRNPRVLGKASENTLAALETLLRFDFPYFYERYEPEAERRNLLLAKTVAALINAQLLDQPVNWLKEKLANNDDGDVRRAVIQELIRGCKDDPDTLPLLKDRAVKDMSPTAKDEEWRGWARDSALQAIVSGWPDDPGTLPLLRNRTENDPTPWLREKARQLAAEIEARRKQ